VSKRHADRVADLLKDLRPDSVAADRPQWPLEARMRELATPAVSIAIIDEGEVAFSGGFGFATGRAAASADTLYQAASLSKPVFALGIMRLVQDSRIDLDADVNDYLTSWRVPKCRDWQPRITLRQLLSHTAGTTVDGFQGYPVSGPHPTLRQVLDGDPPANNPPVVVDRLPGYQTRYSGGGTTIAQQVAIDVMGHPLPALLRNLVLDPLAMTSSTFEQPLPKALEPCAAVGHPWNGVPISGGWHVYPEIAAAGLWTTASDMAGLGVHLLRIWRGETSPLGLDREAFEAMLRPQLPGQEVVQPFRGLGWNCSGRDDTFQFGHRGSNEGYLSAITLLPALGKGAVVFLNSNQGAALVGEILGAIGRGYGWPLAQAERTAVPLDAGIEYAGRFRDPAARVFTLTRAKQGLFLHCDAQPPLLLCAASQRDFFSTDLDLAVRLDIGYDRLISALTITHGGEVIVAERE
jgi:CubicO group peptidase (beta-lactamase class C family)